MSNRAPSIVTNDTASPDPNEHTEKCERRQHEQLLARPKPIRNHSDAERRNRPRQRQRARQHAHLRVAQLQIRLNERHQEAERVPVEQHDPEIEAQ